jgi:hypothetical protein
MDAKEVIREAVHVYIAFILVCIVWCVLIGLGILISKLILSL